ncbi:MAG: hypothetical protein Ct9H300mP14_16150 [Gammaproteobacteria bacterium]|nr:MAG: hypothetical protein Ct9H300mP14_16150 [Gammaproteobacteria bacterium]
MLVPILSFEAPESVRDGLNRPRIENPLANIVVAEYTPTFYKELSEWLPKWRSFPAVRFGHGCSGGIGLYAHKSTRGYCRSGTLYEFQAFNPHGV